MKTQLDKRQSISKRLSTASMEAELHEVRMFKKLAERFLSEHGLLDYFRKAVIHSNNRDFKRYILSKTESEFFENKENNDMDLQLTNAQKLDIKKALKRGIYHELYDRDYLSDAQLNELIERNT